MMGDQMNDSVLHGSWKPSERSEICNRELKESLANTTAWRFL